MKNGLVSVLLALGTVVAGTALLLAGIALLEAPPPPEPAIPSPAAARPVLQALKDFNAIWSDFYATGGIPDLIDAMPASKSVKHGIFRDTGYLLDRGRYQVYDLARMTPVRVDFPSADRAEAWVYEEWNYVFQDRRTREPVTRVTGMGQGFRYRLERIQGRWTITAWDPVDLPAPPPLGFVW